MKTFALALALACLTTAGAFADTCAATAAGKNLAGAAKTSFLGKCQKDAQATCDAQAAEKKLAGAAKTSFTKKCVKDAVGE
ncbi:hypothetical protein V5F59_15975 [Xanthobacter autotrophicus DSM 431]|uniref:hypothetical protein n=1 Tax=Xanthobacter nonsaccharivorans TaxID=3119912 RepID=UPI0037290233